MKSFDDLLNCINKGDNETLAEYINDGIDLHQKGEQGWTALNFAAGRGNLKTVELLIDGGADVFVCGNDNRTPYKISIAAGHAEVAKYLASAEKETGDERIAQSSQEWRTRPYCKAYEAKLLESYSKWPDIERNRNKKTSIIFIHQDYSVTESIWHGEDVLLDSIDDDWISFCEAELGFRVPNDFDLMRSNKN